MDDNEVKKVYAFLSRTRDLAALHRLIDSLPATSFAGRSDLTPRYFERLKLTIPRHLPVTMDIEDAIWILGWATRLMKYEETRRAMPGDPGAPARAQVRGGPDRRRAGGRR